MKKLCVTIILLVVWHATNEAVLSFKRNYYIPPELIKLTTEERVVAVLKDSGFTRIMQRIILAQAKHESGKFTNPLTINHNNIFAMMDPGRWRKTTSLGPYGEAEGRRGFASFATIEQSTRDYILYKRRIKIADTKNEIDYIRDLKRHKYFQADVNLYIKAVQYWMARDSTVRNFSN